MAKPNITLRQDKGEPLSFEEMDTNLINLRDATFTFVGDAGTPLVVDQNGSITIAGAIGSGVSTESDSGGVAISVDVPTALGYTPENTANKNTANGYAGLDGTGKVASAQLPSFVDDVEEYADQASLPATGESGKIYVAVDTGKIYRWSGSAYVEISPSPGTTDDVPEGSLNLYYLDARARAAISATQNLSYDAGTGVITGPDLSAYIQGVVDDTTPQLGGNLNGAGNKVEDVELDNYKETIYSLGTTDSPTIDVANGNVQTVTISSALNLPVFTNAEVGQSVTLIVTGTGTASGTAAYVFAGGAKDLTTTSIVSIFYDGTTYYTSISTDYQA